MARIAGINLPLNKRVEIGLTYVHGVGRSTANKILAETGVDPNTYVKDLTDDEAVSSARRSSPARWRAIFGASVRRTSSDCRRSAPTAGCATAVGSRSAVSAPRPTPAAARARGA